MTGPSLHHSGQVGRVLLERRGGHRQAHDNAALRRLAAEVGQRNPADKTRDLPRHLDRDAGHVQAMHGDRFSQRRLISACIKGCHDFPFVEAA